MHSVGKMNNLKEEQRITIQYVDSKQIHARPPLGCIRTVFRSYTYELADHSGRAVQGMGLRYSTARPKQGCLSLSVCDVR
jgi:hypothetical protein